jgi:hypothetical protein
MKRINTFIGSPIERVEDLRFLRGRGQYVDDLVRPGQWHAAIVRSPMAHGRLRAIDTAAARSMPGVQAVVTARDLDRPIPKIPFRRPSPAVVPYAQPVLADDVVRYVGEPVAMVLADRADLAEDARMRSISISSPCRFSEPPCFNAERCAAHSYDAKDIDGDGAALHGPANLPPPLADRIRELAIKTFRVLCCEGMARIDFFVSGEQVFVNEANTLPGFTIVSEPVGGQRVTSTQTHDRPRIGTSQWLQELDFSARVERRLPRLAPAELFCRAADRDDPSRVRRPCRRIGRTAFAPRIPGERTAHWNKDAPVTRPIHRFGRIACLVGGLHHQYV